MGTSAEMPRAQGLASGHRGSSAGGGEAGGGAGCPALAGMGSGREGQGALGDWGHTGALDSWSPSFPSNNNGSCNAIFTF